MPRWRVTPKIRRTSRRRLSSESVIIINVSSSDFTSGLVDPLQPSGRGAAEGISIRVAKAHPVRIRS